MEEIDVLDLAGRATRAAQRWAPGCDVRSLTPLEGGTVGLVFVGDVHGGPRQHRRVVLKVAPPGLPPVRNRDVLRQARCMAALSGQSGVGVPEVLFVDPGEPDDIPPFAVTSFVAGECLEPLLEARRAPMPRGIARARSFAAVEMLAALRRVRPADVGLGDEPVTTLVDEVDRWTRTLDTVPDDFRVGYERAADALRATAPAPLDPVVVHGDYRLGNMLSEGSEVRAIIDWEIWSVSDSRIDLSWLLFFTEEAGHPVVTSGLDSGVPADHELLQAYEAATGSTTRDLEWFHALTRYKEGAAMALIAKHMMRRDPGSQAALDMAAVCPVLIDDALRRLG